MFTSMLLTVGLKIVGWFKGLTLKQVAILVGLILLSLMAYRAYNHIYDKGAQSKQAELEQWQRKYRDLDALFEQWKQDTHEANDLYQKQQAAIQQKLQADLDAANHKANQRKVEYREVIKYITAEDDARCVIPTAFSMLHNRSIEGTTSASDPVPEATAGVPSTPSTLTLSQYLTVITANNSEAVRRGTVIRQWEQWYDENCEHFSAAQRKATPANGNAVHDTGTTVATYQCPNAATESGANQSH